MFHSYSEFDFIRALGAKKITNFLIKEYGFIFVLLKFLLTE